MAKEARVDSMSQQPQTQHDKNTAVLVRFILNRYHVRGVFIMGKSLVQQANHIHGLQGAPADLFGHVLLSSIFLLSVSKGGIRQVLQFDSMHQDAPMIRMQAETRSGRVRGYLNWNKEAHQKMGNDDQLLSTWMHSPIQVSTVRELGFGTPYVSTIQHDSDYIADHVLQYLNQSTQIRADITLSGAQGLMLEALPECSENDWFDSIRCMAKIDHAMLATADKEVLLQAFHTAEGQLLGEDYYQYQCFCKPESIFQSLQAFSSEQLQELADTQGEISLSCQYCKKLYHKKVIF